MSEMIAQLCLLLLGSFVPMAVKAETCGVSSGPPCNISLVYAAFEGAYLAAITPSWNFEICLLLVSQENNNENNITAYFNNGTFGSQRTETYTFTDAPDVVNMTLDSDPSLIYQYQMLYADLEACFIVNITPADVGCRLWIFDEATSGQITACREVHAQACQGTVYDTWDEDSCDRHLQSA
ncbi:uncharacterized protein LOC144145118 [Haemaphysalis longicornis]